MSDERKITADTFFLVDENTMNLKLMNWCIYQGMVMENLYFSSDYI